jgi:hypothetical protein
MATPDAAFVLTAAQKHLSGSPQLALGIAEAVQQVRSQAALRLVLLVSPLHSLLRDPTRRNEWCKLPIEAVEVRRVAGPGRARISLGICRMTPFLLNWCLGDSHRHPITPPPPHSPPRHPPPPPPMQWDCLQTYVHSGGLGTSWPPKMTPGQANTVHSAGFRCPAYRVQMLLSHEELGVDVEESVLEAAILWLDSNLGSMDPATQLQAASRLLRHIKWGVLLPYAALSAWQRSSGMRLFDPMLHLTGEVLAVHNLLDRSQLPASSAGGMQPAMLSPRTGANGERGFVHSFQVGAPPVRLVCRS